MKALLPRVHLQRCYRHLKEELGRRPTGKESLEIYEKLSAIPKTQNGVKIADSLYNRLPERSPLRSIPKEQLAQVYLPAGACTHGMRTNNPAEVYNAMSLSARQQETLYRSMMATVQLLHDRHERLRVTVPRAGGRSSSPRGGADDSSSDSPPPPEPPRVRDAYAKSRNTATTLAPPAIDEAVDVDSSQVFLVESSAGVALSVRLCLHDA